MNFEIKGKVPHVNMQQVYVEYLSVNDYKIIIQK